MYLRIETTNEGGSGHSQTDRTIMLCFPEASKTGTSLHRLPAFLPTASSSRPSYFYVVRV